MPVLMPHNEFMTIYYDQAWEIADMTIASLVLQNGPIHPAIDVEAVKAQGVVDGLERTYENFDPNHDSRSGKNNLLKALLNTVVHNSVISALNKATTEAIHGGLMNPRPSKRKITKEEEERELERTCRILAGVQQRKNQIGPVEHHVYQETEGWHERKEEVLARLSRCIKKLNVNDQIIIAYWADDEKTYVERSLAEIGMENYHTNANWVYGRKNKALTSLARMMGGSKPDYRDIYLPSAGRDTNSSVYSDRNELRRHQYAAKAQVTKNINYKKVSSLLAEKFFKYY